MSTININNSTTAPTSLQQQSWYHGWIKRVDSMQLLKMDGDFLIRDSISRLGDYVLSGRWMGKYLHFEINETLLGGTVRLYNFEEKRFCTVVGLVEHYKRSGQPITQSSGFVLGNPINKRGVNSFERLSSSRVNNQLPRHLMRRQRKRQSTQSLPPFLQPNDEPKSTMLDVNNYVASLIKRVDASRNRNYTVWRCSNQIGSGTQPNIINPMHISSTPELPARTGYQPFQQWVKGISEKEIIEEAADYDTV